MMLMWDLCTNALDTAKLRGASYGDVRAMHLRQRDLTTKNGQVGTLAQSESVGIGIRVVAHGAWGFASTDRLTRDGVAACAAQAVSIAKASALANRSKVVLAPEKAYIDSWQSPFRKDPFEIPLGAQLALLLAADGEMRKVKGVTLTETSMQFRKVDSWFASSIGSRIHQRKVISGCGIGATSFQGQEIQKRSYPNSFGGQHALEGYELVESLELLKHAPVIAEEAAALHAAAQCPEKFGTLVLAGNQLGLQIHESRSEEHTSELQSRLHLVCRLLLEKKKKQHETEYLISYLISSLSIPLSSTVSYVSIYWTFPSSLLSFSSVSY